MPKFSVGIIRTQVQSENFVVEATDIVHLTNLLKELDNDGAFGKIDSVFDGGEVESIEYEVTRISPCADKLNINSDLQELLD